MLRLVYGTLLVVGAVHVTAIGQEPVPENSEAEPAAESPPEQSAPPPRSEPPRQAPRSEAEGDELELVTGKVLSGVQILKETTTTIVVEVFPGVEPLEIPRRMVKTIKRDSYEPGVAKRRGQMKDSPGFRTVEGRSLSPELMETLNQPLPVDSLNLEGRSLTDALEELGRQTGVKFQIEPEVNQLRGGQATWEIELQPEMTLATLLRDELPREFVRLDIVYGYEGVTIRLKPQGEADKPLAPADTPASPPPPQDQPDG